MKEATIIILACYMFLGTKSFAMNCRVIEYPDHNEAICGDDISDTQTVKAKTSSDRDAVKRTELLNSYQKVTDKISRLQNESYLNNNNSTSGSYFNNSNVSGIVTDATHIDATRSNRVDVTISCDVTSISSGDVSVTIVGKNFDGMKISEVSLHGYVEGGNYSRLSVTKKMKLQDYQNIKTWEAKESKISKSKTNNTNNNKQLTSLIAEAESLQRQLDNISAEVESTSGAYKTSSTAASSYNSNSRVAGDILTLKKGVSFTHGAHQQRFDCAKCHANGSGSIAGFGKDWSHKTCKGCHADMKQGPTSCKDCHK
jgi:hypothetical protein